MEKLCELKHNEIDKKFETTEKRLNNHGDRIDKLEQNSVRLEERLDNLIKQLAQLNTMLRWFIGLMIGAFISFFFYAVQQNIFR
jgi:predicted nuclease with TOPRIM domain